MAEIRPGGSSGMRGRRRTFEDDQAFRVITRLLLDSGMHAVTLPAIAGRLGVTHQSVGRRFLSKQRLLERYSEWIYEIFIEEWRAIAARHASPLATLKDMLVMPMAPRAIDGEQGRDASWLLLMLELRRDREVGPGMAQRMAGTRQMVVDLVRAAQERRELVAADPERIANALFVAVTGAAALWTIDQSRGFDEAVAEQRDLALAPFVP